MHLGTTRPSLWRKGRKLGRELFKGEEALYVVMLITTELNFQSFNSSFLQGTVILTLTLTLVDTFNEG